jgi:ribosomal protein S18 acetylase RimI-like enzyme
MVTIVRVGPGDAELVLRSATLFDDPPTPEHTAHFLASPGHHMLIALDGDDPVGFVSAVETTHPDKGTELLLYELGTREDRRREGIAVALLRELNAIAAELGCYGIWVLTDSDNTAALAAYRAAGFGPPTDSVMLERRLE